MRNTWCLETQRIGRSAPFDSAESSHILDGRARLSARPPATTEHLVPRIKGGPSWIENELAACKRCNGERGHRTPGEWFDECERRGWNPNREAIVRALRSLSDAIAERGGQRRARPYISSQLRRLET